MASAPVPGFRLRDLDENLRSCPIPDSRLSRSNPFSLHRFRGSLRHFALGRASQAVLSLLLTLLAVRLLAPADYGVYMVLWGLVEFGRPLSAIGLIATMQQFLPEMALHADRGQLLRFLRVLRAGRLLLLLGWAGAAYLAWGPLVHWLGVPTERVPPAWIVPALFVVLMGAEFAEQGLEALLDQRFSQAVRALFPALRIVNRSPASESVMSFGTTRESEHVIKSARGNCRAISRSKKSFRFG